jgi:uncharacterized repeat protein (TIGR01451 family)
MKTYFFVVLCLGLATFMNIDFAGAQEKAPIELKAVVESEVTAFDEEGKKVVKRVPAAKVIPGEEVIYTITYTHVGKDPAENVVITNPVPEHMRYKEDSARGQDTLILFSTDQGQTFATPEKLKIRDATGTEYPARASDYTHIRWILQRSLSFNENGQVSFRAILE